MSKIVEHFNLLGEVIDIADKQAREDIKNVCNAIITPEMYGAKGDGITDDIEAINNMFNDNRIGNILFAPEVKYAISKPILIYGGYGNLNVTLSSIIATEDMESMIDIFSDVTVPDDGRGMRIVGGYLNCNKVSSIGIRNNNVYHLVVDGVRIDNYMLYGIEVGNDNIISGEELSAQNLICNCCIDNYENDSVGVGIKLVHPDNQICNCNINNCDTGIEFCFGGNYISNTHITPSSKPPTSQADIKHNFIKYNVLNAHAIQINSIDNCYFNGHRILYCINNDLEHNMITSLNNVQFIIGATDDNFNMYMRNNKMSPLQINNCGVRKSDSMEFVGLLTNNLEGAFLLRSAFSIRNFNVPTQNSKDIVNMDTTFKSVIGATPLGANTLRRFGRVYESSAKNCVSTFEIINRGRQNVLLSTGITYSELKFFSGTSLEGISIYKDKTSKVESVEGVNMRYYDLYVYTEEYTERDFFVRATQNSYPITQCFVYVGNENDLVTTDLSDYALID